TQAALLEAMEERQVTADGETRPLPPLFFCMATENPIEQQGTFPLPEAELDRFVLRVRLGYPAPEVEEAMLSAQRLRHPLDTLEPVADVADVLAIQAAVRTVHVDPAVRGYVVALANATRRHPEALLGASSRGSLQLVRAAQALALLAGDDQVEPDHVQTLAEA